MIRRLLLLSTILSILFLMACNETKDIKEIKLESKIQKIKQEVVFTADGKEIDLGGSEIKKVFYLIRHAEKDSHKLDPPLTSEGVKRAAKLTQMLKQTYIDAVYTTLFARCLQTVDSITQYKGLTNSIYTQKNMKEKFTEVLNAPSINKVLIVGHTNTIPPLANFLYGSNKINKPIDEKSYDNFYIVVHKRDSSRQIYELKY